MVTEGGCAASYERGTPANPAGMDKKGLTDYGTYNLSQKSRGMLGVSAASLSRGPGLRVEVSGFRV